MPAVGRIFSLAEARIERRLTLKSKVLDRQIAYELCLTDHEAYIQSTLGDEPIIAVSSANPLIYESRVSGDMLIVGARFFEIPYGQSAKAQTLIALGRLRAKAPRQGPVDFYNPLIQLKEDALERTFLAGELGVDEPLLLCLRTSSQMHITHSILEGDKGDIYLVFTPARGFLLAVGALGDAWVAPLPREMLVIERRVPRSLIHAGALQFFAPLGGEDLFRAIADLPLLGPVDRLAYLARYLYLGHPTKSIGDTPLYWLKLAEGMSADPWLVWSRAFLAWRMENTQEYALLMGEAQVEQILPALFASAQALSEWCAQWQVSGDDELHLVAALRQVETFESRHHFTLDLARHHYLSEKKPSVEERLAFIEHLMACEAYAEAEQCINAALDAYPMDPVAALLPPEQEDLTETNAASPLQIQLLEALARAQMAMGQSPTQTLGALAQLRPLVRARLQSVGQGDIADLAERAGHILQALDGKLEVGDYRLPVLVPLPQHVVESQIEHPVTREGGQLATLQSWLGKAKVPDFGAVHAYAERLTQRNHPAAFQAISQGMLMLGLSSDLGIYISRGDRSVGVRAHGGSPPFLLVGFEHLEADGDFYLDEGALRFAVGAELAHLRFKHTRLTASEVWGGAFDMGSQILDVSMALLGPLGVLGKAMAGVSAIQHLQRAGVFLQRQLGFVQAGAEGAATVIGASKKLFKGQRQLSRGEVDNARGELLAFCRALQLTADRAGLLLCGDILAATRSIFLSSRRHRNLWPLVSSAGLTEVLHRRGAGGVMLEQDLAVRLQALYAFYLSDTYQQLRQQMLKQTPLIPAAQE